MPHRPLAILLTILLGFQGLFSAVAICVGSDHEHKPTEVVAAYDLVCDHEEGWLGLVPADDHGEECGCFDIDIGLVELFSLPRSDSGSAQMALVLPAPAWIVMELELGQGPQLSSPWFEPGGTQRTAIISSTRLIL